MDHHTQVSTLPLPLDIISEVISCFDPILDCYTIQRLSLTSLAFVAPSQRILFESVEIEMTPKIEKLDPTHLGLLEPSETQYDVGLQLFETRPHLATYVRHLYLTFILDHPDASAVLKVVKGMPFLITLKLHNTEPAASEQELGMDLKLYNAINSIIHSQSLRHLHLIGHGVLPLSVWKLRELTTIDLAKWEVEAVDYRTEQRTSKLSILEMEWTKKNPEEALKRSLQAAPHVHRLVLKLLSENFCFLRNKH